MKIAWADRLSDRMPARYVALGIELQRILTDRGSECRGSRGHHEYELYLDLEAIEHTKTKVRSNSVQQYARTSDSDYTKHVFRSS